MGRIISPSELKAIRRDIEKLQMRNQSAEERLGYRPHPLQFGEAVLGNPLDDWQQDYINDAMATSRIAIAACRQSGKSTVTGIFVAWCLVFIPGFQCLVASRSLRQASHYINTVRQWVLAMVPREAMPQLNRLSMELPNGSAIISIPCAQPDAGRGFSPHLVLLDEAAFAPEALFRAITPSLAASQGALHMISSPNGRQGYFFDAFEGTAQNVYRVQTIPWTRCPRIDPAFIEDEKIALGKLYFRQEYGAEFITPEGAFFGFSALTQFSEGEEEPLGDLDIREMEAWLDEKNPLPNPNEDDLKVAFDRTSRVNRLLYG